MVYYFRSLFPSPPSPGTGRVSWSPCWWSWWWLAWWPSPSRLLLLHQDHQGNTNINKCPALKTLLRNPGHRMVYQQIKYSTFSPNTFNATWVSGKPWIQWKVERLTVYTKCFGPNVLLFIFFRHISHLDLVIQLWFWMVSRQYWVCVTTMWG